MPVGRYPGVFDLDVAILGLALDGGAKRGIGHGARLRELDAAPKHF